MRNRTRPLSNMTNLAEQVARIDKAAMTACTRPICRRELDLLAWPMDKG